MKRFNLILSICFLLMVFPEISHAQFLKKLEKTVKQVAKETLHKDNLTEKNAELNNDPTGSTVDSDRETALDPTSTFDYKKYDINVLKAASASFKKGEYFMENYSTIEAKDNKLFARVVVGVLSEKERMSEGQDVSQNDIAHIYENGDIVSDVILGKLNTSWLDINKQYDWYPIIDVANSGDENSFIKTAKDRLRHIISLNGKTFGPYSLVTNMIVNKSKTKFFAIVCPSEQDMENQKAYLLSDTGKLKPIPFGGELLANINFTNGCEVLSPITTIANQIAHEENEAKQKALEKQMADIGSNHPNEKDVVFFNGKNLTNILTESAWMDYSGNNIFSSHADTAYNLPAGLYLNGKNIASETPSKGEGHAWCNADGSNWAYESYDGRQSYLIFKDGAKVPGILHPREVEVAGKHYMAWYSYDHSKDDEILMCSKEL